MHPRMEDVALAVTFLVVEQTIVLCSGAAVNVDSLGVMEAVV